MSRGEAQGERTNINLPTLASSLEPKLDETEATVSAAGAARPPAPEAPPTPATALDTHHANGLVDQTHYLPPRKALVVLAALSLTVLLPFLDQTIVSTAVPNISASFNSGRDSAWLASAYLLTSAAFSPLWARISDVFGRRVTLAMCLLAFAVGSLACALAQTSTQFVVFRGMQGVGGGSLFSLCLISVSDVVSLRERGKYQAVLEVAITLAMGIGPVVGGVLSENVSWRWCFWINLPISGVSLIVILLFLPKKAVPGDVAQKLRQIDYVGALLTILGIGMLLFGINWGGTSFPWISGQVLGLLFGGAGVVALLLLWEWRVAKIPVVPLSIFKTSTVSAVMLCSTLSGGVILSEFYYIPQFLQVVRGTSAIRSGVLILPLLLVDGVTVFLSGQLVSYTGEYKVSIIFGYALWAVGLGVLSTLDEETSTARFAGFLILTGLGQGQSLQTTVVAAQAAVKRSEMSSVTSTRNVLRSVGAAVALAFSAAIINNTLRTHLSSQTPSIPPTLIDTIIDDPTALWRPTALYGAQVFDLPAEEKATIVRAYVAGFRAMFRVFVGLMGVNFFVAVVFIKRIRLDRGEDELLKERGKAWAEEGKVKKGSGRGDDVDLEKLDM